MKYGMSSHSTAAPALSNTFASPVNKYGRNHETELVLRFFIKTNPLNLLKMVPLGLKLFFKGRMPIFPHRLKKTGLEEIKAIIKEANNLGGEK